MKDRTKYDRKRRRDESLRDDGQKRPERDDDATRRPSGKDGHGR